MTIQLQHAVGILELSQPVVMGVLNVTPDSFSDGGRFSDPARALHHAQRLIEEGAAIIDVGGESTRPGAAPVPEALELQRVLPVIERLAADGKVLVSVDTSRAEVMRRAVASGAAIINDVRALQQPGALEAAASTGAAVCLMHMQGQPATMQQRPEYVDVVTEIQSFLAQRVRCCEQAGIDRARLCLDPGFGFGKRTEDNLALLRGLSGLLELQLPLLVGLSRKSLLRDLTGRDVDQRLAGSVALATIAVSQGAHIIRAHDVAATLDAIRVASAVGSGQINWGGQ